jgi:hypothetical protein
MHRILWKSYALFICLIRCPHHLGMVWRNYSPVIFDIPHDKGDV